MSLQLIIGPMYSGKTTELFRRLRRYTIAGKTTALFRYAKDTRYVENERTRLARSHDREEMPAIPIADMNDAVSSARAVDVIGIDEGQFMGNLAAFCKVLLDIGKVIIISALDGTFQRVPFEHSDVLYLVPQAEMVDKLTAICYGCKETAAFTKRVDETNTQEVDIGGHDKYVASCRNCFNKKIK